MRSYRFYFTANPAANLASVVMVRNGRIKSVRWSLASEAEGDGSVLDLELSTQPASQLATHDVLGVVDSFTHVTNQVTAVGMVIGTFWHQSFVDFPVAAGERLYVHGSGTAVAITAYVHVDVEEH